MQAMQYITAAVLAAFVSYIGAWYMGAIEGNFALLLLLATVSALQADGHLLTAAERAPIDSLLNTLRERLAQGTDPAALDAAAQQLAQGTEAFAAARMNHSIRQALRGQHVQAL